MNKQELGKYITEELASKNDEEFEEAAMNLALLSIDNKEIADVLDEAVSVLPAVHALSRGVRKSGKHGATPSGSVSISYDPEKADDKSTLERKKKLEALLPKREEISAALSRDAEDLGDFEGNQMSDDEIKGIDARAGGVYSDADDAGAAYSEVKNKLDDINQNAEYKKKMHVESINAMILNKLNEAYGTPRYDGICANLEKLYATTTNPQVKSILEGLFKKKEPKIAKIYSPDDPKAPDDQGNIDKFPNGTTITYGDPNHPGGVVSHHKTGKETIKDIIKNGKKDNKK
jgi:hypothetical protein